jgi:hypothetical protein
MSESTGPWVLVGTYRGGPYDGQPQYHRCDTAIGPASTPNLAEAQRFDTKQAAFDSVGFRHWASFLEPVKLSDAEAEAAISRATEGQEGGGRG